MVHLVGLVDGPLLVVLVNRLSRALSETQNEQLVHYISLHGALAWRRGKLSNNVEMAIGTAQARCVNLQATATSARP